MSGLDKGLTDHQHYECKFCLHLFEGNKMLFLASQPFLALLKATTGWQSCAAGEQRAGGHPERADILVLHYMHLSYGKIRNVTATFCACEQKETLEFNYYSCSTLPLSALCLFSIPPTTLGTASRFLFTQWPKSPQNLFSPRSLPTSARFGLPSLCHSMAKLLSWSWQKHLEEGWISSAVCKVLHAFMQGCTYQESENDFPHYVPSYSTRSPDFITKSPNPHAAMPQAACCHSYNTSIVMKQLCWGSQKKCSELLSVQRAFCLPHAYVTCNKANNSWSQIYIC